MRNGTVISGPSWFRRLLEELHRLALDTTETVSRERRVRLLQSCGEAMGGTGRLLVVEMMMPEPGDRARKRLAVLDLNLWLTWGGSIPTRDEWNALFSEGGFELVRVSEPPTPAFPWRVFEGTPQ